MALDGIMLSKIVEDFNNFLPMRINKIYGINKTDLLFHINANKENKILLISSGADNNRIHFTNKEYTNKAFPNNFVMLLRKHLLNGRIEAIKQDNYDRVLKIVISNFNNIGDKVYFNLYLELFGRFSNVIFCDSDDVIFDAIKRISPLDNPKQAVVPGAIYQVAHSQEKQDLYNAKTFDINESFVKQFSGVSPTLDKEIKYRIDNGERFEDIVNKIKDSNELIVSKGKNKNDYHTIKLKHFAKSFKAYTLHLGFDKLYYDKSLKQQIANETRNLSKFINRELKKQKRKVTRLEEQLENNKNADINLKYGDLIITYQHQIKKGMEFVNLIDYETNKPIVVNLDKKLGPIENSQKYYKRYRKQTNSIKHLKEQIQITNKDIDYFEMLKDQLQYADLNSAKEIRQELIDHNYLFEKVKPKRLRKKPKPNYLSINYNDNTVIRVGKNNIQNDYVTFKASNRNDMWFHVQDYHGSHVTVSTDNLTPEIINLCASFAAYYSKARYSKNIPVNYTLVKHVKKVPRAPLGMVLIDNFKTVNIEVDFDEVEKYI